jgi:hypothetical protein
MNALLLQPVVIPSSKLHSCSLMPLTTPPHPTPGKASSGAATAATIQGGPISAAQTYTVSGSLTFKLDDDPARSSGNMFDFSATGNVLQDAAFNQALPSGPPGPFGNEDSPDDIPIDELVEFGTDFLTRDNAVRPTLTPTLAAAVTPLAPTFGPTIPFAAVQLQVLVDVAKTGSVSITTQRLEGSMPRSDLFGTLTLTSTLYEGATSIEPVLPQKRVQLEAVLDSSFVIEGSDVDAQAAALPSDKAASAAASLRQAVRPAQTSSPTLDDQTGTLTVLLSASDFSSTQQTKEFQVVSQELGTAQDTCFWG